MDLKLIRNLIRLMERGEVTELEIEDEKAGLSVRLQRGPQAGSGPQVVMVPGSAHPHGAAPAPAASAPAGSAPPTGAEGAAAAGADRAEGLIEITSPMVGTFYRSPSPESDPFVGTGDVVEEETVVCIIEAMKVMNEIRAECRGSIVELLVDNGEPVEFGQPLYLIRPR
ncbi:MAG: acetyl-CoA carboxylase biotin carboxyl carrier protein [Planctomycetes bacterium]|nr:acetyl-CoA carboxylase biotin carboxyl carrier protein [Planctomycetota bacterium]